MSKRKPVRILTAVFPLFAASGIFEKQEVVFLYGSYEVAVKQGQDLLHLGYKQVSVDRVEDISR